jgi:hypothetical protein
MAVRDVHVLVIEGCSSLPVGRRSSSANSSEGLGGRKRAENCPMFEQGAVLGQRILCGAIRRQAASSAIIPAAVLLIGMW